MADAPDAAREIDWSTAEVEDAILRVALTGEASDEWEERLGRILDRLGTRGLDGVDVDGDRLIVSGVRPGGEGDVRHLLESAVMQANADVAADEEDDEDGSGDERSKEDRGMTQAFRAFAPGESDEER